MSQVQKHAMQMYVLKVRHNSIVTRLPPRTIMIIVLPMGRFTAKRATQVTIWSTGDVSKKFALVQTVSLLAIHLVTIMPQTNVLRAMPDTNSITTNVSRAKQENIRQLVALVKRNNARAQVVLQQQAPNVFPMVTKIVHLVMQIILCPLLTLFLRVPPVPAANILPEVQLHHVLVTSVHALMVHHQVGQTAKMPQNFRQYQVSHVHYAHLVNLDIIFPIRLKVKMRPPPMLLHNALLKQQIRQIVVAPTITWTLNQMTILRITNV